MDDKCHVSRFDKEMKVEATEQIQTISLLVSGMGCINCANRVHNHLIEHPGVVKADVSYVTAKAAVSYIPTKVNVAQLLVLVAEAGDNRHSYNATPFDFGGIS